MHHVEINSDIHSQMIFIKVLRGYRGEGTVSLIKNWCVCVGGGIRCFYEKNETRFLSLTSCRQCKTNGLKI